MELALTAQSVHRWYGERVRMSMASKEKIINEEVTQLSALTAPCDPDNPDREIDDERVGSAVVSNPGGSLPDPDREIDDDSSSS